MREDSRASEAAAERWGGRGIDLPYRRWDVVGGTTEGGGTVSSSRAADADAAEERPPEGGGGTPAARSALRGEPTTSGAPAALDGDPR